MSIYQVELLLFHQQTTCNIDLYTFVNLIMKLISFCKLLENRPFISIAFINGPSMAYLLNAEIDRGTLSSILSSELEFLL